MKIPVGRSSFALVDPEDEALVSRFNWRLHTNANKSTRYAVGQEYRGHRDYVDIGSMHRLILGVPPGVQVDHRNGDGLDNRRANLRACTHAENIRNQSAHRDRTGSPYKGVFLIKKTGNFIARIWCDKKRFTLGTFQSSEDAARAYDARARELFGAFARLNFPEARA